MVSFAHNEIKHHITFHIQATIHETAHSIFAFSTFLQEAQAYGFEGLGSRYLYTARLNYGKEAVKIMKRLYERAEREGLVNELKDLIHKTVDSYMKTGKRLANNEISIADLPLGRKYCLTNSNEFFSEFLADYIMFPSRVRKLDPELYEKVRKIVFGGEEFSEDFGKEIVNKIIGDLEKLRK